MYIVVENSNSNGNSAYIELDRFRKILDNKINEKKKQLFLLHSMAYNNNVQDEINCLKWVLGLTNNQRIQIQISQVENIVQNEVNKFDATLHDHIDSNDTNGKINNTSSSVADTSKDITKLPLPTQKSPRRTKYMMQVERIRIRQMLLDGYSEDMIAQKLNLGDRQVQKYIEKIRQIDYDTICQVDDEIKSHMIFMTRDELNRLKSQMLAIVFSPNASDKDKIEAAVKARGFMLDVVTLTIRGPLAFSIKRDEKGKQPVISK